MSRKKFGRQKRNYYPQGIWYKQDLNTRKITFASIRAFYNKLKKNQHEQANR